MKKVVFVASLFVPAAAMFACGDDTVTTPVTNDGGSADGTVQYDAAPSDGAPSDGSKSDSPSSVPTLSNVVKFDVSKFELPEGVAYRNGYAFVGFAPLGKIVKIGVVAADRSDYAQLPTQASNFTLGMTFDAAGNLYVGVAATNPGDALGVAAAGVYKIPPNGDAGGTPVLIASSTTGLKFPNGLSFDPTGTKLYVADSAAGAIYKLDPNGLAVGTATPWKSDAAFTGDQAACPATVAAFPIGINGIVAEADAVYGVNTDRGTFFKVAVDGAGAAGAVTNIITDCATLEGADGLDKDPRSNVGTFVAVNNRTNLVLTLPRTQGGTATPIYGPTGLDSAASILYMTGTSNPTQLLITNAAFVSSALPADAGVTPNPSLVKLSLP